MRSIRGFLLSIMLFLSAALSANGVEVDGIYYQLDTINHTAKVTYTGTLAFDPNSYQGAIVIPPTFRYEGTKYKVTSIGMFAFNSTSITSVTIPSTVSSVYNDAFWECPQLDTIYCRRQNAPSLNNGSSFSRIRQGVVVEVPAGALYSYSNAKGWKSLTLVENSFICGEYNLTWSINATHDTLSITGRGPMLDYGSISAVPWNAYKRQIRCLQLCDEITHIGAYSFCDISLLDTIRLPRDLQSLGFSAYSSCSNVDTIIWNDSIETIGDQAFVFIPVKRWVIPSTVRSIGRSALLSDSLMYVEFQSLTPPSVHAKAFGIRFSLPVHVPCQAIPSYRDAMAFDLLGIGGPNLVVLPNDTSLGDVSLYPYNCDSVLLTATANEMATFRGWSDGSTANPRVLTLEQDCTLTANFYEGRLYRIAFLNSDSSILEVDSVCYGEMPVFHGETPQMPGASPQETVLFKEWYPALQPVTTDTTYIARYRYIGTTYDGLCFHADTVSTISMSNYYWNTRNPQLQYSEDGRIWYDWDYSLLTLAAGDSLFFRGNNPDGIGQYISWLKEPGYSTFVMTGQIRATGNIISLIDTTMTARTLPSYCFSDLFKNCTSLVEVPDLDVDTLGYIACSKMYMGTGIKKMPLLPAMQLGYGCYSNMFSSCQNLEEVTPLPALELAEGCYFRMFEHCPSLKHVQSVLPAIQLEENCYWGMYGYCPQIEVAPEIMAEGLAPKSCIDMFINCSSLREIRVHFYFWVDVDFMAAMGNWVAGVSPTGVFYCPEELDQIMDDSHIPNGWLVNSLTSAVESIESPTNTAAKTLRNGQLIIITPQGEYSASGMLINK